MYKLDKRINWNQIYNIINFPSNLISSEFSFFLLQCSKCLKIIIVFKIRKYFPRLSKNAFYSGIHSSIFLIMNLSKQSEIN